MLPPEYACPRCTCCACYALHRKGLDWVFSLVGLRPARCLTCGKKFFTRYMVSDEGKFVLARESRRPGSEFDQAA